MNILSFDIGTKNMAFCVLSVENDKSTIKAWEHFAIKKTNNDWCVGVCKALNSYKHVYEHVTQVLLEMQPKKGTLMRAIQNYVHCYFVREEKPVRVVQAHLKLADTGLEHRGKAHYSERKKASVAICVQYLNSSGQSGRWTPALTDATRRHDLADALLQALRWANVDVTRNCSDAKTSMCQEKVNARKPTTKQLKTGDYSKSNIKYLLREKYHMSEAAAQDDIVLQRAIKKFFPDCGVCIQSFLAGT